MKKIIFILSILFIFSCNSGGSSGSSDTGGGDTGGGNISNCNGCPSNSLSSLIELIPINASNSIASCDYSEISNLGCVNVIQAEVNEDNQTIDIYYTTDFNIAGFQFQINGITITSVDYSYITSANGFSVNYNEDNGMVIAFNTIGESITDRCGMFMRISYTSPINNPWNSSDFISDIVFASEVNENDGLIPTQPDVCFN